MCCQALYAAGDKHSFELFFEWKRFDHLKKFMESVWRKRNENVTEKDKFVNVLIQIDQEIFTLIKNDKVLNQIPDDWEDDFIMLIGEKFEEGYKVFYWCMA